MSHKFVSISIVLFVLVLAAGGCMPPALGPVGGPTPAPEAKTPVAEMTAATPPATAEPQPEPQATAGAMGLRLLAPDVSKPVELAPTVSWEAIPGARSYKVWISDAGTTELLVQQEVTDLSLALGQPLKPGRTYSLLVQALDANKQAITELRTEFTTAGEAVAPLDEPVQQIPSNCYQEGLLTYVDREAQICFAYPQGFALGGAQGAFAAGSQARAELRGPEIGAGPEPLFARLSVDFEPYQGVDLPQFVDEMIKRDVPAELVGKVERRQETWARHAAEVLEPWPGQLSSRIVVVDAAPLGFDVLTFWPSFKGATSQPGADALKAEADMEDLYEIVAGSFATLPPPGVPIAPEARVDLPKNCLVSGQPLYIDADQGYCMALTPEMTAKREENGSVGFYGPALDQSPDPLRASLGVTVEPVAKDATLDKTVETYLASLGELGQQVKRAGLTLGGEPAVRLDGIPGRPSAIEVLALHEGKLAWLRFAPDLSFEKSQTEVEALVQAVTSSFGFLPGRDQTAGGSPAGEAAVSHASYRGVSFAYPQSVAASAEGSTVPAHDEAGGPWWEVAPQHVEIALAGYALPKTLHEPRVAVYPTAEFAAQSAQAAAQIEGLKQLLQAKPENPEGQLPFLPLINAGQMMHLRVKYLPFKGGEGVSYLTQLAQGLTPINNEELFYTFQGLAADGKYYVSAILPVSNKSLPETANDLPAAQMKAMNANFKAYVNEVTQTLASAGDASFTPVLAELDGLVQSIEVKPDAAAQATVVQIEMGRYPDIDPGYSVQQIPAVPPGDNVSWFDAHPPLTLVTLPGYAGGRPARLPYYFSEPTVQVYRVADFAGFGQSSETLSFEGQYEALKKLLDEKAPLTACSGVTLKPGQNQAYPVLPLLPLVNAAQVFCTQPAYVNFEGGKGIRYVTAFSQSPEPVSDLPVFYTFQGLTDDGEHYVLALLPVATGIQPAQGGEGLDANAWTTMLKEWVGKLGALDSSGFRPSLEALDLLVGSIAVR